MCVCVSVSENTGIFADVQIESGKGGNREGGKATTRCVHHIQFYFVPANTHVSRWTCRLGYMCAHNTGKSSASVCSSDAHNVYAICKAIFVIFLSLYFIAASRCTTTADLNLAYQNVVLVLCKQEICIHDS